MASFWCAINLVQSNTLCTITLCTWVFASAGRYDGRWASRLRYAPRICFVYIGCDQYIIFYGLFIERNTYGYFSLDHVILLIPQNRNYVGMCHTYSWVPVRRLLATNEPERINMLKCVYRCTCAVQKKSKLAFQDHQVRLWNRRDERNTMESNPISLFFV